MGRLARALTATLLVAAFAAPGGLAAGGCTAAHAAGSTRRAGLVVELPGETKTFCVSFTAAEEAKGFTGTDLLERSGLPILYGGDRSAVTVCRVEDVGCSDVGRCFCDCPVATAASCRFWGYYTLGENGGWVFSQLGASARRIHDGDVDAWRYANHYAKGAGAPAAASLSKLCSGDVRTVSSTGAAPIRRGGGAGGLVAAAAIAAAFVAALAVMLRRRRTGASP